MPGKKIDIHGGKQRSQQLRRGRLPGCGFRRDEGIAQGKTGVFWDIKGYSGWIVSIYPLLDGVKKVSIGKRQQVYLDLFDKGSGLAVHLFWKSFLCDADLIKKTRLMGATTPAALSLSFALAACLRTLVVTATPGF